VPPVSCEHNAVPSEPTLRSRCNLKQPGKLTMCVHVIFADDGKRAISLFMLVKRYFLDCVSKITCHVSFTFLYCKSVRVVIRNWENAQELVVILFCQRHKCYL